MPKISIITPCYNSERFLESTFQAVIGQTFTDWEWIIVDDCSDDDTHAIIQKWSSRDPRIKVFKNEKNSGASPSRNQGLDKAQGEYIAFLDSDDLWNKDKLEKQLSFMEEKKHGFTYHNYNIIDFSGKFQKIINAPIAIKKSTLEKFNPIFTSSVMMKKSDIGSIRFRHELRRRQDYIFWFQVIQSTGSAHNVCENLGAYRVGVQTSLSHNKFRVIPIQWNIYRKEFRLGLLNSMISLAAYAFHGIRKYFL